MSILLDYSTRVMVQGITGGQARRHVQFMQDYGTRIVCGVSPGKGGQEVHGVPVYDSVRTALAQHEVDMTLLFLAAPRVLDAALEAIEHRVPTLVIHEDGVPQHDVARILWTARAAGVRVIGPNSQGIVSPGKAKVGGSGGEVPERVFRPGPVGVMSRSGGMGIELCLALTQAGIGQSTYVAVGGDPMIGTTFVDLLEMYGRDPETRVVLLFGEMGGLYEEKLADYIQRSGFDKPVVGYIAGESLEKLPRSMSFGHTRSLIPGSEGTVREKKEALRAAGVRLAEGLSEIPALVAAALEA